MDDVSAENIVDEFTKFANDENLEFESLVKAYIILVGVTKIDYKQADEIFDKMQLSLLQWGTDIRIIYNQARKSTSLIFLNVGPQNQIQKPILTLESTNKTNYTIPIQTEVSKWASNETNTTRKEVNQ